MAHNVILSELDYLYTKVPKKKKKGSVLSTKKS